MTLLVVAVRCALLFYMVTTHENIVDPVLFVESDSALVAQLEVGGALAISGADFDVSVRRPAARDVVRSGRINTEASRFLGNLYIQSAAYGVSFGRSDNSYDFEWYPSPNAVNNLVAALGLKPGEDTMKFTHSEGAKISAERYFEHVLHSEYPQSTDASSDIFAHDRNQDHAIGVLLTPKIVKDAIVNIAERGGMRTSFERNRVKGLAHVYDSTTAMLGLVADRILWPRLVDEKDKDRVIDDLTTKDTFMTSIYYPGLWPTTSKRYKQQRHEILTMISDHLFELQPKVAALQAEDQQATLES